MLVQLLKNMSRDFMEVLPQSYFIYLKWKSTLCDRFSVLCIKLYIHDDVLI